MAQDSSVIVFDSVSLDGGDAETRFGVVEAVIEEIEKNIEIPVVNNSTNPFEVKNVDKVPYSEGKSEKSVHFTKLIISTNERDPSVAEIRVVTDEREESASDGVAAVWSEGSRESDVSPTNFTAEQEAPAHPVPTACAPVQPVPTACVPEQPVPTACAPVVSEKADMESVQAPPIDLPAKPVTSIKVEQDLLQMLGEIVPIAMQPLFTSAFTPTEKKSEPSVYPPAHSTSPSQGENVQNVSTQSAPSAENIGAEAVQPADESSHSEPVSAASSPTVGIIVGEEAMTEISLPPVTLPGSSHFEDTTHNGTPHHRVRISIDHRSKTRISLQRTAITVILVIVLVVAIIAFCVYQFVLKQPPS